MTTTMNSHLRAGVLLLVALVMLGSIPLSAQKKDIRKYHALIFGTVYGPDMRPAAGVVIKIRRADQKKPKWELVSDRRGEFAQRFPVGAAEYIVSTHVEKRYNLENKEIKVRIENDERRDIALHLTQIASPVKK
jgi:hypothetical protein